LNSGAEAKGNNNMKIRRIRSLEEYCSCLERSRLESQSVRDLESSLEAAHKGTFTFRGFSYPAAVEVDFLVDYQYGVGGHVNWRERLICPITHLNNRVRASIQLLDIELAPYQDDLIFLTEQVTPLYQFLKSRYSRLIGSEYRGNAVMPGRIDEHGIRHEDMTRLSFETESIDYIMSFDCFEHFPDFQKAFTECARVLKPGGRMLWTVPFVTASERNIIRARVVDGRVEHLLPPEYHGDPVNTEGCLCFTHFGWDMLRQVRSGGFSDAYAIPYGSKEFGYLGAGQIVFVAVK
jgi:hypothetical protein